MKGVKRSVIVEGLNLERFIRLLGEQGIVCSKGIRRGRKYTAVVGEDCLPLLTQIAEQGGWKFSVGSRLGAGRYLNTIHRHWLLVVLAGVICAGVAIASRFIWFVTLIDAGPYQADAEQYLQGTGIYAPMWKANINLEELRDLLEWRYPDVAWIDCGWRGTELRITFVHGISAEHRENISTRDVVASRGGIVDSIVTLAGTPAVSAGEVIKEGQVLIHGYERSKDETLTPVSARGIVKARVWDRASAKVSIYKANTNYTGHLQKEEYMSGPFFRLWQPSAPVYEQYDIKRTTLPLGGLFFPFTLCMEERRECTIDLTTRAIDEVKREAGEAAYRLLVKKTGFDDDFVDKWIDYCMIEDEEVCAIAYGERIVDVASYD